MLLCCALQAVAKAGATQTLNEAIIRYLALPVSNIFSFHFNCPPFSRLSHPLPSHSLLPALCYGYGHDDFSTKSALFETSPSFECGRAIVGFQKLLPRTQKRGKSQPTKSDKPKKDTTVEAGGARTPVVVRLPRETDWVDDPDACPCRSLEIQKTKRNCRPARAVGPRTNTRASQRRRQCVMMWRPSCRPQTTVKPERHQTYPETRAREKQYGKWIGVSNHVMQNKSASCPLV